MAARNITAGQLAAFVITTASTVALVRVLIEIRIVSPSSFMSLVLPLMAELAVMVVLTGRIGF